MAESWKSRGICESMECVEGNELAHEMDELSTLKTLYDVLIVVTSSYGDGDPPDNYNTFPAEKGDKPLATLYLVRAAPFTAIPSLARDA